MEEHSIVRRNLLTDKNYTPYCGNDNCKYDLPRTSWNGNQFQCRCGWVSRFPEDFIDKYKKIHKL